MWPNEAQVTDELSSFCCLGPWSDPAHYQQPPGERTRQRTGWSNCWRRWRRWEPAEHTEGGHTHRAGEKSVSVLLCLPGTRQSKHLWLDDVWLLLPRSSVSPVEHRGYTFLLHDVTFIKCKELQFPWIVFCLSELVFVVAMDLNVPNNQAGATGRSIPPVQMIPAVKEARLDYTPGIRLWLV